MARAKRKKVDSWKTKEYYEIIAPKMFREEKLGETLSSDPNNLVGRTIKTTLRDITGDFSKQHIKLEFKVENVKGKRAHTKFVTQSLSRDYMRSQIRRKTTRIEGIVDVQTKDGYRIRVKTIALAIGRAQTAQEKLVRKAMFDVVSTGAGERPLDDFVHDVVMGRVTSLMQKKASKIYPLKRVEIRKIKVLEEPGKGKNRKTEKPEENKAEEPKKEEAKPESKEAPKE